MLAFWRFGPYHRARLAAASRKLPVVGLEMGTVDLYAWTYEHPEEGERRITLFPGRDADTVAPGLLVARIGEVLDELRPAAVAVPGWSQRSALALLSGCRRRRIPAILMADSTRDDADRRAIVEAVKRQVVRQFWAALVAGRRHRDYVVELGLNPRAVFEGYDAVDNAHYERGVQAVRADPEQARRRHALPHRFFLASNRFIEKKNLFRLLSAYARYRMSAGCRAWKLVLLGDGELRPKLEAHRRDLGLEQDVLMPGFKQYEELPVWYGLASAFVHASAVEQWGLVVNEAMASGLPVLVSNRCGCAPDLVKEAVNGFTFDPYDIDELAGLMYRIAHGEVAHTSMGRASEDIIKHWGPERFADGLLRAVEMAWHGPAPTGRMFDRMLLRSLMYRKPAPF